MERGVCEVWPVENLYHIGQEPLLNGLRLIVNLIPFNRVCEPLVGEVTTLPSISSFHSFLFDEGEIVVMSAEDIRCFFYLFQVPVEWRRFLGFNKEVDGARLCFVSTLTTLICWSVTVRPKLNSSEVRCRRQCRR